MARTKRAKQMRFSAAHAREAAFHDGGLRSCFEYRDLGIAKATGGRARNEAMASLVVGWSGRAPALSASKLARGTQ